MILTVDIGNTATTMGLYTPEGTLRFRGALKTDKNKTQDQLAIDLLDMFHLYQADIGEVTGGNAALIQKYCRREIHIDENLLLDGLYYLYQKNQDRRRRRGD